MTATDVHIHCNLCDKTWPQDPCHVGYPAAHLCVGSTVRTVSYFEQLAAAEPAMFQMMLATASGLLGMRVTATTSDGITHDGIVLTVSADVNNRQILMGLTSGSAFDFADIDTVVIRG